MTPLDVMRSALDVLLDIRDFRPHDRCNKAITNLRTAIAEMESAEPVAYVSEMAIELMLTDPNNDHIYMRAAPVDGDIPLFTHPAPVVSSEPVAWLLPDGCIRQEQEYKYDENAIPLYLHPAQSRDSIIEECLAVAEWCNDNYLEHQTVDRIRALKGK